MKNYLLFSLVGFLLISCSTTKLENEIIENFLNEKHKNDTEKVFLINKALSKKSALSIYEYAYNRRDLTYYLSHPLKDKNNWLLNTTTLIRLKKLYNKDTITYYWKKTDFENLNVPIMEYPMNFTDSEVTEHLQGSSKGYIISRPVLFSNNKNALLCFSSYSIILGGSSGRQIYILKKIKGKWIVEYEYFDGVYN
jgi:hypothetical protein